MSMSTPGWTDEQIEKFSKHIIPMRCTVTVGVVKGLAGDPDGGQIRCGQDMHPGLGCREKFEWGGSHGFEGDPRRGMTFRSEVTVPPATENAASLTIPDDYKPHPVSDGGVGSGGRRRLDEGDSGKRRRVVVDGEIAGAVLGFLPKKFVHLYEQLCDNAYGERRLDGSSATRRDTGGGRATAKRGSGRLNSGQVDKTLVASTGGKTKNHAEIAMKSEAAVDFRRLVDRRLRRLAREIEDFLRGDEAVKAGRRKCGGRCRKIGDADWIYCARCGGPMQEVDGSE